MKGARLEYYWGLHHGQEAPLSKMPQETYEVVFDALKHGEMVGQYTLPLEGDPDMMLFMPKAVTARELQEEERIEQVREELRTHIRIPQGEVKYGI